MKFQMLLEIEEEVAFLFVCFEFNLMLIENEVTKRKQNLILKFT